MAVVTGLKKLFNFFRLTRGAPSGMHTDMPISQQPENTVRNAWGVTNGNADEEGGGLYNMQGQEDCAELPAGADKRGQHLLEERNQMVVFLNIGGKSEIGYWSLDECVYKKIIDDNDIDGCKLDFGSEEWIPIVSKNMLNGTCNEIHLYWSNGSTYKTLNIDRPCIPVDCDEINLFNCKCLPIPKAYTNKKGGHDLEVGAYQYFAQLQDEDGNVTNWFSISNPIYIGSKNNRAGDISDQAITITIDHLDPDYPYVNLGCVKTVGGHPKATAIARLSYSPNGVSFFHRSRGQHLYDLEIEEILVKNPGYIRGNDLFQHDRVLYLFNTKPVREIDMQARIIESVRAKYKVGRVRMRDAHLFSGNQRDGVYSYFIKYNHCDGRSTRGFHIPCFGIEPTAGPGCYDCEDANLINNAPNASINGKPYDNPITKGSDVYTPFTETKTQNLGSTDFDLPNDEQFVPPASSGEGNDCGCWAMGEAFKAFANRPWSWQGFEAAYNFFKDICESGCVNLDTEGLTDGENTPEGLSPRSSADDETMPTDEENPAPDDRFKTIDDISLTNGEKPSDDQLTGSTGQGGDGNNSPTNTGVHTGSVEGGTTSGHTAVEIEDCEPTIIYADADCCVIKEIIPCIDSEGLPIIYYSCEKYPNEERCCSPGKTYGSLAGKNIQYFRMPSIAQEPHFISYQDGVPTSEHRDNHEYNNSFARFLWLEFSGIPLPDDSELDVPLCPINPFTICWEQRSETDDTVIASGVLLGTFEGETLGETMLFPNHGTNSDVHIDRWINNGGSHKTDLQSNIPAYVFHSPDTAFNRPALNPDYMVKGLTLTGRGWRHGLYAEGADPENSYTARKNRKGARASMNLNKWEQEAPGTRPECVIAASYVPAHSVLDKADEFTKSLSNLNRESCVYIETNGTKIPMQDTSFNRNIETHQVSLGGMAKYVSLNRYIPNAYGGITDNVCYPIWEGSSEDFDDEGKKATVLVRAGDTFINYWSIKRTSYVSNHVAPHPRGIQPNFEYGGGITLPWPFKTMLKKLFNTVGADCECGTVPMGGNSARDPRASNADNGDNPGHDRWFPQVQTQLLSFPVESKVNLGFQGSGDDASTSTYRDLNGQTFDSSFDGGDGAYEKSWMDRYGATMCENAKWKCLLRFIFNIVFTYVVGILLIIKGLSILTNALTGTTVGFTLTILSIVAVGMGILFMLVGFVWIIGWVNTDLDNRMIDNILKISDCFPDKPPKGNFPQAAIMKDSRVQGFEDNHYEYNYDFSRINRIQAILGLPAGFDPCHCPNETVYPFWHSNPQNPQSKRDAYRNFKTNGYFDIPTHHGKPQKMFNLGNSVYVQTTDVMFQIMSGNVELKAGGTNVYLETSGTFLRHPQLVLGGGIPEGKGGTRDPNACEVTPWGYLTVDSEARDFFLFTGSDYQPLGIFGKKKFFDQFMPFEDSSAIRDEKAIGGIGFSIGVDNGKGLLFITKHDRKKGETKDQDKNRSWTLSFDVANQAWLSHEYFHPLVYAWDRFNMFSYNEDKVWKHNKPGEFLTVYGKSVPMVVDFVIRDKEKMDAFSFHNTVVDAEFAEWDDMGLVPKNDLFFTEIGFHNSYQSSGLLPVIRRDDESTIEGLQEYSDKLPVAYIHKRWRFSKLKDRSTSPGQRLFTTWRDSIFTDFAEGATGPIQTQPQIIDSYMVMRLIYEGGKNVRVLLKNVITSVNPEEL